MLKRGRDWDQTLATFWWRVPMFYNIGIDACDKWADGGGRPALTVIDADGNTSEYSFDRVAALSNRLANALVALGAAKGDRVAIHLPQGLDAALAHIACYKAGLVAVPLFSLFGPDALLYRLNDSGARILITEPHGWETLAPVRDRLEHLEDVLLSGGGTDDNAQGLHGFDGLVTRASDRFEATNTKPTTPALLIYTSGTTGPPKGALHGHGVLLGHLPGIELALDFFAGHPDRAPADRVWTPADWAWVGGLLDTLLPAWHHGYGVVAHRMAKFDPDRAFDLIARHQVRYGFVPPTALKMMRAGPDRRVTGPRALCSGGEPLGAELQAWAQAAFGAPVHELYGQTECNLVVAQNSSLFASPPGSMGRAVPGHEVAIVDRNGHLLDAGAEGEIAVKQEGPLGVDPVMFQRYWNNDRATREKFIHGAGGAWLLTGDQGWRDEEGNLYFRGRADDVITSSGYRIGPGEIEDCLLRHPAVAMAAVVGVPDATRTEIVKAVIVPKPDVAGDAALKAELQDFVKTHLSAHAYPRQVEFRDDLPKTATGKIRRRDLRTPAVDGPPTTDPVS